MGLIPFSSLSFSGECSLQTRRKKKEGKEKKEESEDWSRKTVESSTKHPNSLIDIETKYK